MDLAREVVKTSVGSRHMLEFRENFRERFAQGMDFSKMKKRSKERVRNAEEAVGKAEKHHNRAGVIVALLFWGVSFFLIVEEVPFIENHIEIMLIINTYPMVFLAEIAIRRVVIEIISYKDISSGDTKANLIFMEAWNKSLKSTRFLTSVYFISIMLKNFRELYEQGMDLLFAWKFTDKSLIDLLISRI